MVRGESLLFGTLRACSGVAGAQLLRPAPRRRPRGPGELHVAPPTGGGQPRLVPCSAWDAVPASGELFLHRYTARPIACLRRRGRRHGQSPRFVQAPCIGAPVAHIAGRGARGRPCAASAARCSPGRHHHPWRSLGQAPYTQRSCTLLPRQGRARFSAGLGHPAASTQVLRSHRACSSRASSSAQATSTSAPGLQRRPPRAWCPCTVYRKVVATPDIHARIPASRRCRPATSPSRIEPGHARHLDGRGGALHLRLSEQARSIDVVLQEGPRPVHPGGLIMNKMPSRGLFDSATATSVREGDDAKLRAGLWPVFEGIETFDGSPPDHKTAQGAHIRDQHRPQAADDPGPVDYALMPCAALRLLEHRSTKGYTAEGVADPWRCSTPSCADGVALPAHVHHRVLHRRWPSPRSASAIVRKPRDQRGLPGQPRSSSRSSWPPTRPCGSWPLATLFGIVIGKEVFGGVGMNILNPALTARAFVFFAYPAQHLRREGRHQPRRSRNVAGRWNIFGGDPVAADALVAQSGSLRLRHWSTASPAPRRCSPWPMPSPVSAGDGLCSSRPRAGPGCRPLRSALIPGSVGETSSLGHALHRRHLRWSSPASPASGASCSPAWSDSSLVTSRLLLTWLRPGHRRASPRA